MAEKTIKQRIELTGEKQYTQAIRDATRNLKVMQSQMKAETAELGKNATAQQKDEVKTKSLTKQIAEQEKIVQTLKEALERAREEYGDNADVVAKWETKLNNARTTLGNMRSELDSASEGAKKSVVAIRSVAEAFGSLGEFGSGVSDKIQETFLGMADTIRDVVGSVWEDIMELAGRANDWADLAGTWNTTAANIQKWYHAVESSHNDFASLNGAVAKIYAADQQKVAELAHVSAANYKDEWEYAMAVLDSLAGMNIDQRNEAVKGIFGGKKVEEITGILNDWGTIQTALAEYDVTKGGIGMTEEQMQTMSELAEKVDHIQQTWGAFKDAFIGEHVANLALDLTGNVQGALDALISFMDAETEEEREAALEDFTKNIENFFTRLGEAISAAAEAMGAAGQEMQGSENGIVRALGDLLVTLQGAMEWFADEGNIDLVIKGFEALAAFWIAGKGLQMAASIAAVVKDIATIQAFNAIGGAGAGAAAGTGGGNGAADAATGAVGGSLLSRIPWGTVAKVAGGGAAFLGTLFGDLFRPADPHRGEASEIDVQTTGPVVLAETEAPYADLGPSGLPGYHADRRPKGSIYDRFHEEEEDVLLDAHTREEAAGAIQDWWDAWRDWNYAGGEEGEADSTLSWMEEVLGDSFGDIWDRLMEKLDETEDQENLEDIPAGWYKDILDSLDFGEQNGVTSDDISGLRGLPALIQAAAESGTASGVSGISVNLDGYRVGELVAPYVSRALGGMITR